MSSRITINKYLEYEVPNFIVPKILDLVASHETEGSKEYRKEHGMKDWPGSPIYHEELELAVQQNKEVFS